LSIIKENINIIYFNVKMKKITIILATFYLLMASVVTLPLFHKGTKVVHDNSPKVSTMDEGETYVDAKLVASNISYDTYMQAYFAG